MCAVGSFIFISLLPSYTIESSHLLRLKLHYAKRLLLINLTLNPVSTNLILTCEHATNFIPEKYKNIFSLEKMVQGRWGEAKVKDVLADHWGWDIGALSVAEYISKKTSVPLSIFPVSRLLIEGNRYLDKSLFSEAFTAKLPPEERSLLKEKYWQSHIDVVCNRIKSFSGTPVLHVAIHSFTPVFNKVVRQTDLGILFDPKRPQEKILANNLQKNYRN